MNGLIMLVQRFQLLVSVIKIFDDLDGIIIIILGLRDFPSMEDVPNPMPSSKIRSKQFEQNAESIFILPALELRFQTRQLDGKIDDESIKTLYCLFFLGQVHCSFETEFYEHIMFSFNAEHFYFLHDLVSSYIKEKEKGKTLVQFLQ